jgi:hypothetical protein
MLKRTEELFRRARESRREAERFTEPSYFHQLSHQWKPVTRNAAPARAATEPERKPGLPLFWQKSVWGAPNKPKP